MSETPPEFDLKFLPDWLKESANPQKYANYEGGGDERPRGRGPGGGDRGERRGPRPGGPGGGRPGPGGPRENRGPRPGGPGGSRPGGQRPGGDRRGGPGGRPDDRGARRDDRPREPRPAPLPAEVRIEFLPEPGGAASIAKQVKGSGRAYPLFATGRLFMERPERYRVRLTSQNPAFPLHQIGDGPVAFDRAAIERNAFRAAREEYYKEEVVEGEPIKGNYANVARLRGAGIFLGPTNYHAYQPALRRIYEERFSRRMSFPEFVQTEVQVLTDEQSIADWKEKARSTTTYTTVKEAEPVVLKTLPEVEAHFRQTYLPQLVTSAVALECSGQASRELPERSLADDVLRAWEQERGFPVNLVNHLRPYLVEAGLHFFKHRKRILYLSSIKPVRHLTGQALSSNIEAILRTVEASPRCTRRDLAIQILGENADAPEMAEQKAALARDFLYLAHAGHVIEFHDGALDLPLSPGGAKNAQGSSEKSADFERDAEREALAETGERRETGKRTDPRPPREKGPARPPGPSRPAGPSGATVPQETPRPSNIPVSSEPAAVRESLSSPSENPPLTPVTGWPSPTAEEITPPAASLTAEEPHIPDGALTSTSEAPPDARSFEQHPLTHEAPGGDSLSGVPATEALPVADTLAPGASHAPEAPLPTAGLLAGEAPHEAAVAVIDFQTAEESQPQP